MKAAKVEIEAKLKESESQLTEAFSELQMQEAPDLPGHFVLKGRQWAHMGTRIQMNRRLLSCLEASVKEKDRQLREKEAGALLNR